MGKSIPDVRFELNQVYKTYADQLELSGNISRFLLDNSNIDSAGEQIEGGLRVLLKNLLPEGISVSHGHIVDKNAGVSYQQDILIAESLFTRSLIKTLDGTEFYPYESIFAAGEVKKTWSQTKLEAAIKSIKRTKSQLSRREIPNDQISSGSTFIKLSEKITHNPFRNPLFTFTFSLDFDNKYNETRVREIYNSSTNQKFLPNISVILKQGIFVSVDEHELSLGNCKIKLYPEFNSTDKKSIWVLLKLTPEQNLAYLIFMLTQHINDTILEKVSAMEYGNAMIEIPKPSISPL